MVLIINCKTLSRLIEQGYILRRGVLSATQQHSKQRSAGKIPHKRVLNGNFIFLYFFKNRCLFDLEMK